MKWLNEIKMAENIRKAISAVLEEAKIYSCDKWKWFYYRWCVWIIICFGDVIEWPFVCFSDVIGGEQVWWLSINLQSNKVTVIVQFFLLMIVLRPPHECRRLIFFFIFFTTHIACCRFDSRKSAPPLGANYCLRGGEYMDPITPPCGILLMPSADILFPATWCV